MARTPKIIEDRREQIMEAALIVFAEKGFADATNKDIAQEAGITPGLIYHYFASKEALLEEIIKRLSASRSIRPLPQGVLALPIQDLLKTLALRVLNIVEDEKYTRLIKIYLPEVVHDRPGMVTAGLADIQEASVYLEEILSAKIESGEIPAIDTKLTAQIFLSALIGFVLRRQVFKDPSALAYSHEQIASSLAGLLVKNLSRE